MCDTLGFNREAPSGEEVSLKNYAISARASPKRKKISGATVEWILSKGNER